MATGVRGVRTANSRAPPRNAGGRRRAASRKSKERLRSECAHRRSCSPASALIAVRTSLASIVSIWQRSARIRIVVDEENDGGLGSGGNWP